MTLPTPALCNRFRGLSSISCILGKLLGLKFSSIFRISTTTRLISTCAEECLGARSVAGPTVDSTYPIIAHLVNLEFHSLASGVVRVLPPVRITTSLTEGGTGRLRPRFSSGSVNIYFVSPYPTGTDCIGGKFTSCGDGISLIMPVDSVCFRLVGIVSRSDSVGSLSGSKVVNVD